PTAPGAELIMASHESTMPDLRIYGGPPDKPELLHRLMGPVHRVVPFPSPSGMQIIASVPKAGTFYRLSVQPGDGLQVVDSWPGPWSSALVAADIDGDGTTEVVLGTATAIVILVWRDGPAEALYLPGLTLRSMGGPVDVDGDGDHELLVHAGWGNRAPATHWLGTGTEAPPQMLLPIQVVEPPDLRDHQLEVTRLAELMELRLHPEVVHVTMNHPSAVTWPLELLRWVEAGSCATAGGRRWLAECGLLRARLDLRTQVPKAQADANVDPVRLDLRGGLGPEWVLHHPAAVRYNALHRGVQTIHVGGTGGTDTVLSLPVAYDGGPLRVEVDHAQLSADWARGISVELQLGDWVRSTSLRVEGGGSGSVIHTTRLCDANNSGHRSLGGVPPFEVSEGTLGIAAGAGFETCIHGDTQSKIPLQSHPPPGTEGFLRIRAPWTGDGTSVVTLQEVRLEGLSLHDHPEDNELVLGAVNNHQAALETLADGDGVMSAVAAAQLGLARRRYVQLLSADERVLLLRRSPQQWARPMRDELEPEVFATEFLRAWQMSLMRDNPEPWEVVTSSDLDHLPLVGPSTVRLNLYRAQGLLDRSRTNEALRLLMELDATNASDGAGLLLAQLHMAEGDEQAAAKVLEHALTVSKQRTALLLRIWQSPELSGLVEEQPRWLYQPAYLKPAR
ncbi:MAG: hypothetical protein ACI9MC_001064, partial [Kiritimatiellia bacterium]